MQVTDHVDGGGDWGRLSEAVCDPGLHVGRGLLGCPEVDVVEVRAICQRGTRRGCCDRVRTVGVGRWPLESWLQLGELIPIVLPGSGVAGRVYLSGVGPRAIWY
jgi:hypothetical protein